MMRLLFSILKTGLLISALLLMGQIPIGPRTVGGHLAHSLYLGVVWVGNSLRESEWFARMSEQKPSDRRASEPPKGIRQGSGRVAMGPKEDGVEKEKITSEDRESLVHLLEETD